MSDKPRQKPYARTIPHPLFERLIVDDAMNVEEDEWKPERYHEYGYFPGCVDFMDVEVKFTHLNKGDADHASIAAASIKLLNYADIDPLILDMNVFKCSGHDQLWQGNLEVFDSLKEHNMRRLKESGIKIITCSCAECYRTFAVDYDLPGTLGIKVEHITQTLQGRGLKFKAPENVTVSYHDPCRLGRMMGEYEAPRDLIQLVDGATMVELENNKERALCCGVSSMMYCNDATKAVRRKRLDQGTDAGIDIMLGGCPKCYMHMQCMLNEERMNPEEGHHHDYEMMDLMQFLVACLEDEK